MRAASAVLLGALATGLGGCGLLLGSPEPTPVPRQIGVQLIVRGADQPSEDLILEIGELAWLAPAGSGGSVAWPILDGPRAVRLLRAATCEVLVGFEAPLDTRWHLELGADGNVTVTDATQLVFEWGPGMVELTERRCR